MCCRRILECEPQNAKALFRRGVALTGLERYEEAQADLKVCAVGDEPWGGGSRRDETWGGVVRVTRRNDVGMLPTLTRALSHFRSHRTHPLLSPRQAACLLDPKNREMRQQFEETKAAHAERKKGNAKGARSHRTALESNPHTRSRGTRQQQRTHEAAAVWRLSDAV